MIMFQCSGNALHRRQGDPAVRDEELTPLGDDGRSDWHLENLYLAHPAAGSDRHGKQRRGGLCCCQGT